MNTAWRNRYTIVIGEYRASMTVFRDQAFAEVKTPLGYSCLTTSEAARLLNLWRKNYTISKNRVPLKTRH